MSSLADLIGKAESENNYNAYNRGTAGGKILGAKFKRSLVTSHLSAILADMDLPPTNTNRLFAVGRYQIIQGTLKDAIESLKLDKTAVFDEALQDKILTDYILKRKRPQIFDYICGLSSDIKAATLAASKEWASIADPNTGYSHYGNGNVASVTAAQLNVALKNARVHYTEIDMTFEKVVFLD
jgi:hypothetical protein